MTREQKIEWLEKASAEQLLAQYDSSAARMSRLFECGYNVNETIEDYELTRAEVLKRLSK